jgi:hypothetical protein
LHRFLAAFAVIFLRDLNEVKELCNAKVVTIDRHKYQVQPMNLSFLEDHSKGRERSAHEWRNFEKEIVKQQQKVGLTIEIQKVNYPTLSLSLFAQVSSNAGDTAVQPSTPVEQPVSATSTSERSNSRMKAVATTNTVEKPAVVSAWTQGTPPVANMAITNETDGIDSAFSKFVSSLSSVVFFPLPQLYLPPTFQCIIGQVAVTTGGAFERGTCHDE